MYICRFLYVVCIDGVFSRFKLDETTGAWLDDAEESKSDVMDCNLIVERMVCFDVAVIWSLL